MLTLASWTARGTLRSTAATAMCVPSRRGRSTLKYLGGRVWDTGSTGAAKSCAVNCTILRLLRQGLEQRHPSRSAAGGGGKPRQDRGSRTSSCLHSNLTCTARAAQHEQSAGDRKCCVGDTSPVLITFIAVVDFDERRETPDSARQ